MACPRAGVSCKLPGQMRYVDLVPVARRTPICAWTRRGDRSTQRLAVVLLVLGSACNFGRKPGAPVRLRVGAADTLVVNNQRPVPIPIRALDATGQEVPVTGVRYEWIGGDTLPVTPQGLVTCPRSGDATVRASVHAIATTLRLRCRPVDRVRIAGPMQLLLGDSAQVIPLEALDTDGKSVDQLAGTVSEDKDGVYTVERGLRLRPRVAGASVMTVVIGDRSARVGVHVYAPASDLAGLRRGQDLVAVSLRLASGEVRRWSLPTGGWMLTMLPYEDEFSGLRVRVEGADCKPLAITRRRLGCAAKQDATIIVYNPSTRTAPAHAGQLLVRRVNF